LPIHAAGNEGNPLLACLLAALGDAAGATQAAAAAALAQCADHLAPVDPALLRQLLHQLDNPLFQGRAELWRAVARLEGAAVRGLAASSRRRVLEAMPELLGSAAGEHLGTHVQAAWPQVGVVVVLYQQAG
jgi:hypothetical protein